MLKIIISSFVKEVWATNISNLEIIHLKKSMKKKNIVKIFSLSAWNWLDSSFQALRILKLILREHGMRTFVLPKPLANIIDYIWMNSLKTFICMAIKKIKYIYFLRIHFFSTTRFGPNPYVRQTSKTMFLSYNFI